MNNQYLENLARLSTKKVEQNITITTNIEYESDDDVSIRDLLIFNIRYKK